MMDTWQTIFPALGSTLFGVVVGGWITRRITIDVLRALTADADPHVRRNVANLLSRIAVGDQKLAAELAETLRTDASWMVRNAARSDEPLSPTGS